MNIKITRNDYTSKPKVNRLPLSSVREQAGEISSDNSVIWRSLWAFVAAAFVVIAFVGYQYGMVSSEASTLSPDDARLISLVDSPDDVSKVSESSVFLNDDDGVIVGQMVRIASESERTLSNKITFAVVKPSRSELLSILSKH